MAKNLVEEFEKRKTKVGADENVRFEENSVYQEALKDNRFDRRWYPAGELATVTFENGQSVTLEIEGVVKGELLDSNGTIYGRFKGVLDEVDDVLTSDKQLKGILSGDDDLYLDLSEDNRVIATSDVGTAVLDDNIAKALFNVSAYRHLSEKQEQEPSDDQKTATPPTEEPTPEGASAADAAPEAVAETDPETVEATEVPEEANETAKAEEVSAPVPDDPKPSKKPGRKKKKDQDTNLESSGQFETFDSGAVRDTAEGKGRCDLLPLDVAGLFLDAPFFKRMQEFKDTGDPNVLIAAAKEFSKENFEDDATAILEWAVHMENGARKYGDNNWQKGIPLHRYVDSAIRHYLKFLRGDEDERHDRAVIWNCLCGAWTAMHHPDLNQYPLSL